MITKLLISPYMIIRLSLPFLRNFRISLFFTLDTHRYPTKLCPSHNPNPHHHESLHGGSCVHQQHTCQQSPRGAAFHTCEMHSMGPGCIHKQQHICRSNEQWQTDIAGAYPQRRLIDQPPPNSPQSERNASEASGGSLTRTGSVHQAQGQVVPIVNVAEYDDGSGRDLPDTVSRNSGGGGHTVRWKSPLGFMSEVFIIYSKVSPAFYPRLWKKAMENWVKYFLQISLPRCNYFPAWSSSLFCTQPGLLSRNTTSGSKRATDRIFIGRRIQEVAQNRVTDIVIR